MKRKWRRGNKWFFLRIERDECIVCYEEKNNIDDWPSCHVAALWGGRLSRAECPLVNGAMARDGDTRLQLSLRHRQSRCAAHCATRCATRSTRCHHRELRGVSTAQRRVRLPNLGLIKPNLCGFTLLMLIIKKKNVKSGLVTRGGKWNA